MLPDLVPESSAVLAACARSGVIPVVTLGEADEAEPLSVALAGGGLDVVEITLRTSAGLGGIARLRESTDVIVGAGTVTTAQKARDAIAAGARFLVSPGLDEGVVEVAHEHGVDVFPGVATPTEMMRAQALGVRVLKLFPAAQLGGPSMVSALAALDPDVQFVPTGGITIDTAPDYLRLASVLAVGGSWLTSGDVFARQDWPAITERARATRAMSESVR